MNVSKAYSENHHMIEPRTGELLIDRIELLHDQSDLTGLPRRFAVCSALVVLATGQRPVFNLASTGFVATEVIRNHLARQLESVLARDTPSLGIVGAVELAVNVILRDIDVNVNVNVNVDFLIFSGG
jgi:hypothetical protein